LVVSEFNAALSAESLFPAVGRFSRSSTHKAKLIDENYHRRRKNLVSLSEPVGRTPLSRLVFEESPLDCLIYFEFEITREDKIMRNKIDFEGHYSF